MEEDVEAALFRAAVVRPEKWSAGVLLTRFSRFWRDDEEIERFCALTSNISRFLFVTPASIAIRMHIRLAKVKPNGRATQTNRPAPIFVDINDCDVSSNERVAIS